MELTRNELEIMEVLWEADRPLTGTDIVQMSVKSLGKTARFTF